MQPLVAATNGSLRVLLLTAEEGDGHFATARALTEELLAERAAEVYVWDVFKGGFGRLVPFFSRDAYRVQLRRAPWTYGLEYTLFTRFPPTRGVARAGLAALCSRPLLRLIRSIGPDLIVSTHPAVTSVLGHLRRSGDLHMPTVATVTDLDAHPFWSHSGVDLHLVMHESCRDDVERNAGRNSARVVRPIVADAFRSRRPRNEARAALGLPASGPVVLVTGGGWAVGDLEGTVRAVLQTAAATVVCVTGRHEPLRERVERSFGDDPRVVVLGFTDRMPELLSAADVLVDATVGLTCLEALTCGCRVVVFGAPPGHFRDSAREMTRLGLAVSARTPDELADVLERLFADKADARPVGLASLPTAATLIASARVRARALPGWRRRLVPALAGVAATLGFGGFTFASALPYPIIARTFGLRELTAVQSAEPEIGLVIDSPEAQTKAIAGRLARGHAHATFALAPTPSATTLAALARRGDEVVPRLDGEKPTNLLAARRNLSREARLLRLGGHFYYLAPHPGFTLAEYVAARSVGGTPVDGAVRVVPRQALGADDELRAGAIVVVEADSTPRSSAASVGRVLAFLRARGLRPVPLRRLLASASSTAATAGVRAI
jgi:UDP-N-acetylglucosamine:LPS N-acetylglucosamine transferase